MKKRLFIIFILMITIILFIFLADFYWNHHMQQSLYVPFKERQSYILNEVDQSYLNHYLKNNDNKNTLVIFFATWCMYCMQETTEINDFITKNPDTNVIVVSHDHEKSELKKFLDESNFQWLVIFDSQKTIREHIDPGSRGIPSVYLLDQQSHVVNKYIGNFDSQLLEAIYRNEKIEE